ncbi:peptidyl-prolyl cis-trans isomerase [Pararhizobium sp. DWP1-1-3]|uniref:peptidylprolyl isomerase n=1 Tax=Pararhizobium sp. DWP1-1-3 TaxID=2804652 RepID=UPI003CF69337
MTVVRRIVGEPLVHFLLAGGVIFASYALINQSPVAQDKRSIEVGQGQFSQLFETFSRTWQRPPTRSELQGLVDGYVKEEVFYREGQDMGLDLDDTIFRRRMQQKLEFLLEPSAEEMTPTDGVLEAYFHEHAGRYEQPTKLAFQQIFFKSSRPGDEGELAAKALLARLSAGSVDIDAETLGDASMLPSGMGLTDGKDVEAVFGREFLVGAQSGTVGKWSGPFRSSYGAHLVFLNQSVAAGGTTLAVALDKVRLDWESDRRREITDKRYAEMRAKYDVKVLWPAEQASSLVSSSGVE